MMSSSRRNRANPDRDSEPRDRLPGKDANTGSGFSRPDASQELPPNDAWEPNPDDDLIADDEQTGPDDQTILSAFDLSDEWDLPEPDSRDFWWEDDEDD